MAYLAVLGASRGRLAGFSAVLGIALGLALLGMGNIFAALLLAIAAWLFVSVTQRWNHDLEPS